MSCSDDNVCHVLVLGHVGYAGRVAVLYEILQARRLRQPVAYPDLEKLAKKPTVRYFELPLHKRSIDPPFGAQELAVPVPPRDQQPGKRLVSYL